jgi:hypothetical protein
MQRHFRRGILGLLVAVPLAGCGLTGLGSYRSQTPPHTRIGYSFKSGGQDRKLFIWSDLKLRQGDIIRFAEVTAVDGRNYIFEDGQKLLFSQGRVTLSGKSQGVLSGSFVLGDRGLETGFIRTFD